LLYCFDYSLLSSISANNIKAIRSQLGVLNRVLNLLMSQVIAIAQSELRLATFHHGGRIAALIEAAGCRLLYLPPYSPDFNRIEKCWAWLKSRIRNNLSSSGCLRQAMESVLKQAAS
jgi:hypothetical protein